MPEITKWGSERVITTDPDPLPTTPKPYLDAQFFGELIARPGGGGELVYWERTITGPPTPPFGATPQSDVVVRYVTVDATGAATSASVVLGTLDAAPATYGDIGEVAGARLSANVFVTAWVGVGLLDPLFAGTHTYSFKAAVVTPAGVVTVNVDEANAITGNFSISSVSVVAVDSDSFAIVYSRSPSDFGSFSDGLPASYSSGVYARIFSLSVNGAVTPDTGVFRVNTDPVGEQKLSSAVALGSNFLVTWNDGGSSFTSNDGTAVKAKIFDAAGNVVLSDTTLVSAAITGRPVVAALADGHFALAWTQAGDVYARVFDQTGAALSAVVRINDFTTNFQELPQIAASLDGGFVVIFTDSSFTPPDTNDSALRAQKFDASGARVGVNVIVPTTLAGSHAAHELQTLSDGRIAVEWHDAGIWRMQIIDDRPALLYGTAGVDVIYGVDNGAQVNNVIVLGAGDDGGYGLAGNDYLYGGSGNDAMAGGAGVDVLLGEAGNDQLFGEDDNDYLYGGDGNDALTGGAGVDVMIAGTGDDTMNGGAGGDYFYGEDGNDTANGDDGNDIFVMGNGNDTGNGGDGQDYFYMGAGDDVMTGGAGVDVMLGEAGNDTFNSDGGVDYLYLGPKGAGDNDTVVITNTSGTAVVYDFEAGGANDVIRLQGTAITTFAQAQAAITDYSVNGFIVLTVDSDTNIWLIGVTPGQLTTADFLFA